MNHVAEPIYLKMELPEDAKKFYDEATPEDACSWVESFINLSIFLHKGQISEVLAGYGAGGEEHRISGEAFFVGALQKIIDTVRGKSYSDRELLPKSEHFG